MANKKYNETELIKNFKGRFINVNSVFNYDKHEWEYEVVGISKKIKENFNLPKDCIVEK